jgi:hypothetical protein
MGKAHSGKDTVANYLFGAGYGVGKKMAFADKLKEIAAEMFDIKIEDFYTQEGKDLETPYACLMCPECHSVIVDHVTMEDSPPLAACKVCGVTGDLKVFESKWTNRKILQYLGTEGFRRIDPGVWVRFAMNKAKQFLDENIDDHYVVISDCRFKSEATAIWAAGGEVWRIKRPETDKSAEGLKGHASEVEQESITDSECQAVIQNDGTLENLKGLVNAQLQRFLAKY